MMNLLLVLILSSCSALASSTASEVPMPPLPDFAHHVDYMEYLQQAGQECRVQTVNNHQAKDVSCPRPSEQVRPFIMGVLENPQSWNPAEHKDVAKWVDDVQADASRSLDDLPWMVFDPKCAMFSDGTEPVLAGDLLYPNLSDLMYVVYADIMASLRDGQENPMPYLEHALSCLKDCSECRDFVSFSAFSRFQHKLVLSAGWLAQNREIPLDSFTAYIDQLAEIQSMDMRQRFDAAMHVECASMLSLIQQLGKVGPDGEVRYDPAKVKTCSELMTDASAWAMLNREDADPQQDAKLCLAYFEDVCEAIEKTVKRPKTGGLSRIDEKYAKNQYFASCFPPQWAGTWIPKMLEFERDRRLDMLTLKLVAYQKEHGEWPKNLRPVTQEDKSLGIDPLTGRRFKYYVKKNEARLDKASLVVGASG